MELEIRDLKLQLNQYNLDKVMTDLLEAGAAGKFEQLMKERLDLSPENRMDEVKRLSRMDEVERLEEEFNKVSNKLIVTYRVFVALGGAILSIVSLYRVDQTFNIISYLNSKLENSTIFEKYYTYPNDVKISQRSNKKKNLFELPSLHLCNSLIKTFLLVH